MAHRGARRWPFVAALAAVVAAGGVDSESPAAAFWEDLRRRGLSLRLAAAPAEAPAGAAAEQPLEDEDPHDEAEGPSASAAEASAAAAGGAAAGARASSAGAVTLGASVPYGRPVLRIPLDALLSPETVADETLEGCLADRSLPRPRAAVINLALAVAFEERAGTASPFARWLGVVLAEPLPPVLSLTERQLLAIAGTTVDKFREEVQQDLAELQRLWAACAALAGEFPRDEAARTLGVVLRYSFAVEDERSATPGTGLEASPVLVPLVELLGMERHPDIQTAVPLQASQHGFGDEAEQVLVQAARRDLRIGEKAPPLWLGRYSNSELAMRHGLRYHRNPVGIGGRLRVPENWSPYRKAPNFKEYARFNCSSPQAFELRFSPKGWPMRSFIRCSRIARHLARGSYEPAFGERIDMLNKWPPPKKYTAGDWLAWTQVDQEINQEIHAYCTEAKRQLKEAVTSAVADDFRKSVDVVDVLLWRLRTEETRTFRECVALSRSIGSVHETS